VPKVLTDLKRTRTDAISLGAGSISDRMLCFPSPPAKPKRIGASVDFDPVSPRATLLRNLPQT